MIFYTHSSWFSLASVEGFNVTPISVSIWFTGYCTHPSVTWIVCITSTGGCVVLAVNT